MVEAIPHRTGRRASTADQAGDSADTTQAAEVTEREVMAYLTGRAAALAAQAAVLLAVGLVLIVGVWTTPAIPAAEPTPVRLRPATEAERRDYDARRLADALDEEWRRGQQAGAAARRGQTCVQTRSVADGVGGCLIVVAAIAASSALMITAIGSVVLWLSG